MTALLIGVTSLWMASLLLMSLIGLTPALPALPIIGLLLSTLPVAHACSVMITSTEPNELQPGIERRLRRVGVAMILLVGALISPLVTAQPLVAILLFAWLATRLILVPSIRPVVAAALILLANSFAVLQLNNVALRVTAGRLKDAVARSMDVWVLKTLGWPSVTYEGFYPIVPPLGFKVLEGAYFFFLTELLILLFIIAQRQRPGLPRLQGFVGGVVGCYLVGLSVFLIVPVAGPCLFYPESISQSIRDTLTYEVMNGSRVEFDSIRRMGQPVTGLGYFVAFPSLHVALVAYMQLTWARLRMGAAALPLNILIVIATVLLGWHYVIDIPAGLLLGLVMFEMVNRKGVCTPDQTEVVAHPHASA